MQKSSGGLTGNGEIRMVRIFQLTFFEDALKKKLLPFHLCCPGGTFINFQMSKEWFYYYYYYFFLTSLLEKKIAHQEYLNPLHASFLNARSNQVKECLCSWKYTHFRVLSNCLVYRWWRQNWPRGGYPWLGCGDGAERGQCHLGWWYYQRLPSRSQRESGPKMSHGSIRRVLLQGASS